MSQDTPTRERIAEILIRTFGNMRNARIIHESVDHILAAVGGERWVSVNDRMPDDGALVLTCEDEDESSILVRYYDGSEVDPSPWQPGPRHVIEGYPETITHWRPLPPPPAVGE